MAGSGGKALVCVDVNEPLLTLMEVMVVWDGGGEVGREGCEV